MSSQTAPKLCFRKTPDGEIVEFPDTRGPKQILENHGSLFTEDMAGIIERVRKLASEHGLDSLEFRRDDPPELEKIVLRKIAAQIADEAKEALKSDETSETKAAELFLLWTEAYEVVRRRVKQSTKNGMGRLYRARNELSRNGQYHKPFRWRLSAALGALLQ